MAGAKRSSKAARSWWQISTNPAFVGYARRPSMDAIAPKGGRPIGGSFGRLRIARQQRSLSRGAHAQKNLEPGPTNFSKRAITHDGQILARSRARTFFRTSNHEVTTAAPFAPEPLSEPVNASPGCTGVHPRSRLYTGNCVGNGVPERT